MDQERIAFLEKDFLTGFPSYCGFEVIRIQFGEMDTKSITAKRSKSLNRKSFHAIKVLKNLWQKAHLPRWRYVLRRLRHAGKQQ
jgi:hypothetical protein